MHAAARSYAACMRAGLARRAPRAAATPRRPRLENTAQAVICAHTLLSAPIPRCPGPGAAERPRAAAWRECAGAGTGKRRSSFRTQHPMHTPLSMVYSTPARDPRIDARDSPLPCTSAKMQCRRAARAPPAALVAQITDAGARAPALQGLAPPSACAPQRFALSSHIPIHQLCNHHCCHVASSGGRGAKGGRAKIS